MKIYELYFQRNFKVYVVTVQLNEMNKVILDNFTNGAILIRIKEVKENEQ